jgi:hypothetical protein
MPAPAVPVEVGRGRADGNEADIHVDAVPNADDVAQQPPVLVDAVSCRLGKEPYTCAARKQRLRPQRRRPAVTLAAEVDLGRVDLDETDALAIAKDDGVAVADVIDPVDGRRCCDPTRRADGEREERYQAATSARRAARASSCDERFERSLLEVCRGDSARVPAARMPTVARPPQAARPVVRCRLDCARWAVLRFTHFAVSCPSRSLSQVAGSNPVRPIGTPRATPIPHG